MLLTLPKPPSSCVKGRQKLLFSHVMIQTLNKIMYIKHPARCPARGEHLQMGLWTSRVPESQGSWLTRGGLPSLVLLHCRILVQDLTILKNVYKKCTSTRVSTQRLSAGSTHWATQGSQRSLWKPRRQLPGGPSTWRKGQGRVWGIQQPIAEDLKGQP